MRFKQTHNGFIQHHFVSSKSQQRTSLFGLSSFKSGAGFTLIELLVVVAIIGLLLAIVSLSLTAARSRARDARRVSDLKQVKTGLDLFLSHANGYPDTAGPSGWIPGTTLQCNAVIVFRVPRDPQYPVYDYTYTTSGNSSAGLCGTVWTGYTLSVYIENKGGYYTMDEEGVVRDAGNVVVSFDSLLP